METHFARIREDEEGITAVAMAIASSIAGGLTFAPWPEEDMKAFGTDLLQTTTTTD